MRVNTHAMRRRTQLPQTAHAGLLPAAVRGQGSDVAGIDAIWKERNRSPCVVGGRPGAVGPARSGCTLRRRRPLHKHWMPLNAFALLRTLTAHDGTTAHQASCGASLSMHCSEAGPKIRSLSTGKNGNVVSSQQRKQDSLDFT